MSYHPYRDHEHERWLLEREELRAGEEAFDEWLDERERFEPHWGPPYPPPAPIDKGRDT